MSGHALLGASSSARWIHCPPSARLCETFPDTASEYAAAGTLAHSLAELKARKYFFTMSASTYRSQLQKIKADPLYEKRMDETTDQYLEYLKALAMGFGSDSPFVALETRVDYSGWAPEGFGTADCIMIAGDTICVIDYKNGAGVPVEAEDNSQMMLYALGALQLYAPVYGDQITKAHLSIVQPNAGGIKEWDTTTAALRGWGESVVKSAAALAWEGKGDFSPGEWCRFCRARSQCTARARQMLELEPLKGAVPETQPHSEADKLLTDVEIGDVLTRALELESWVKDLKDYALNAALSGREIAGWKAVEGRGSREWISGADTAFTKLQERGIQEALLYERKPVSVAGLEKALGKKLFSETADGLWEKTPGKPALVPIGDKRPPYAPAQAQFHIVDQN